MTDGGQTQSKSLERYREYLQLLARLEFSYLPHNKLDSSDLVQQTLLRAHQNIRQFRGQTTAELAGWLRVILARTAANEMCRLKQGKRNVALERSLEAAVEESSIRVQVWLAADQTSPSDDAIRQEQLLSMAEALAELDPDQRAAIELHHLKGHTVAEIAEQWGRTRPSVAGLIRRGLQKLRTAMKTCQ